MSRTSSFVPRGVPQIGSHKLERRLAFAASFGRAQSSKGEQGGKLDHEGRCFFDLKRESRLKLGTRGMQRSAGRLSAASRSGAIAELMARFRQGDQAAAGDLVEIFYPELRRLAGVRMLRERQEHSWQPTVLVNELYLELVKIKALRPAEADGGAERKAFLGLAAHLMRRLLIHHARPLSKRVERAELPELPAELPGSDDIALLEQTLDRLAAINPKLRTVVELRVFEGLTGSEIASRMECGTATVARHWAFARQWLADELGESAAA